MKYIRYRDGYKYQLAESYECDVGVYPKEDVESEFIRLSHLGELLIKKGYSWNGADVVIDTKSVKRASLIHDSLYQLMRQGLIRQSYWTVADLEFKRVCLEDGMMGVRAWYMHRGLRLAHGAAADPDQKKEILTAP